MTQNQIYGKSITFEGDQSTFNTPLTMNSTTTFPLTGLPGQNPLQIFGQSGRAEFGNPAVAGPPVVIAVGAMNLRILGAIWDGGAATMSGVLSGGGLIGTLTAGTASILIVGWVPLAWRPIAQRRIPISGAVGPVAQPTTFVFQFEVNGDVRIFKDTIGTAWNAGDTFTINVISEFSMPLF